MFFDAFINIIIIIDNRNQSKWIPFVYFNIWIFTKCINNIRFIFIFSKERNSSFKFVFNYRIIEEEKKESELEEYLEGLIEKPLYKDEQKELAEKVNIRKDGKLLKSINSINAYFEEVKLNYYILAKRTKSKRYWIIIKDVDK